MRAYGQSSFSSRIAIKISAPERRSAARACCPCSSYVPAAASLASMIVVTIACCAATSSVRRSAACFGHAPPSNPRSDRDRSAVSLSTVDRHPWGCGNISHRSRGGCRRREEMGCLGGVGSRRLARRGVWRHDVHRRAGVLAAQPERTILAGPVRRHGARADPVAGSAGGAPLMRSGSGPEALPG